MKPRLLLGAVDSGKRSGGRAKLAPVARAERDGAITAFNEPSAWPETLKQQWKIEVGTGIRDAPSCRRSDLHVLAPGRR